MSGARFVCCPTCGRFMLGQRKAGATYPQPHECESAPADEVTA